MVHAKNITPDRKQIRKVRFLIRAGGGGRCFSLGGSDHVRVNVCRYTKNHGNPQITPFSKKPFGLTLFCAHGAPAHEAPLFVPRVHLKTLWVISRDFR